MIRVLSVDDHPLLREGIAALIENQTDMELVAEAGNGREGLDLFRTHRPDITLMDLQMPEMSGIDAIGAIRGDFPDAAHHRFDNPCRRRSGFARSEGRRSRVSPEGSLAQRTAGDDPRGSCRPEAAVIRGRR